MIEDQGLNAMEDYELQSTALLVITQEKINT